MSQVRNDCNNAGGGPYAETELHGSTLRALNLAAFVWLLRFLKIIGYSVCVIAPYERVCLDMQSMLQITPTLSYIQVVIASYQFEF